MVLNLIIEELPRVPRFSTYLLQPFCINIVKAFWRHNGEAGKENVLRIRFVQLDPSILSPYLDKIEVAIDHSLPESKGLTV